MKIKRFVDKDMRSVLKRVRNDQGAEAVILSNRRIDEGIEVIAAVDYDEALMQHALRSKFGSVKAEKPAADRLEAPVEPDVPAEPAVAEDPRDLAARLAENSAISEAIQASRKSLEARDSEAERQEEGILDLDPLVADAAMSEIQITHTDLQATPTTAGQSAFDTAALATMQAEISSLRDLLEGQVSGLLWADGKRRTPKLSQALRAFARMGVAPDVSESIVAQLGPPQDWEKIGPKSMQALQTLLPVKSDALLTEGGIVALIGPTGVGKTTTIAKLAARFAIANGTDDIALVCADAYRIGAREHLSAFANILGIEVFTADGPEDLQLVLAQLSEKKLVLIDTEGLSLRDPDLSERLECWRHNCDTVKFYLTLSARSQEAAVDEAIRAFRSLPLAGAIVTKIDEAGQLGCVISALIRRDLPLAWLTDGQNIPDDLRPAAGQQAWLLSQAVSKAKINQPLIDEFLMAENYATVSARYA